MPFTLDSTNTGALSQEQKLARDGNLWVANTPTPGTAIAYAILTSFSATANGLFLIRNTNAVGSNVNIYLRRLELFQTATVATGTTWSFECYNETALVTATGNAATITPIQVNSGKVQTTGAIVQAFNAGAMTIPAASGTRRLCGQFWIPVGVNVVKDIYTIDFGSDGPASAHRGGAAARLTDTGRMTGQGPAVCIPPQSTSWINMWGPGSSAPSFEYNLTYVERLG